MSFVATASAHDTTTVELPPPLGMTLPDPMLTVAPAIDPQPMTTAPVTMNIEIPPPAAMRFITLGRVTFASGKSELSDAAKQMLDKAAAYLAGNPGMTRLLLDGHTDSVGGAKFNNKLSDKRAMAVEAYLTDKGINPRIIHWRGHGKHTPIDENWARIGRNRNRHVELYAVYLPQ